MGHRPGRLAGQAQRPDRLRRPARPHPPQPGVAADPPARRQRTGLERQGALGEPRSRRLGLPLGAQQARHRALPHPVRLDGPLHGAVPAPGAGLLRQPVRDPRVPGDDGSGRDPGRRRQPRGGERGRLRRPAARGQGGASGAHPHAVHAQRQPEPRRRSPARAGRPAHRRPEPALLRSRRHLGQVLGASELRRPPDLRQHALHGRAARPHRVHGRQERAEGQGLHRAGVLRALARRGQHAALDHQDAGGPSGPELRDAAALHDRSGNDALHDRRAGRRNRRERHDGVHVVETSRPGDPLHRLPVPGRHPADDRLRPRGPRAHDGGRHPALYAAGRRHRSTRQPTPPTSASSRTTSGGMPTGAACARSPTHLRSCRTSWR